jgi:hypothetical protein
MGVSPRPAGGDPGRARLIKASCKPEHVAFQGFITLHRDQVTLDQNVWSVAQGDQRRPQLIEGASRARQVPGVMLHKQRRPMPLQCAPRARDQCCFVAFDIRLDEIDARQLQRVNEGVQRRHGDGFPDPLSCRVFRPCGDMGKAVTHITPLLDWCVQHGDAACRTQGGLHNCHVAYTADPERGCQH